MPVSPLELGTRCREQTGEGYPRYNTKAINVEGFKFVDRFRIQFEDFDASDAPLIKAQGWIPFKLVAMPDVQHPSYRYIFGVRYADVDLQYDALRTELGDALDRATIRWAVAQVEDRLRLGRIPHHPVRTGPTEALVLTETNLALLRSLALVKTCEYQVRPGRDLLCSAATADDPALEGTEGLRRLARTSRPLCKQCDMPDSDFVCSRLSHPRVKFSPVHDARFLSGAFCEEGRSEVKDASHCHPGGHPCWKRIVEPPPEPAPAVPFSPRDLPVALDFLNAIWERAFNRPLLRLRSVEKTAALSLGCATHDEFRARLEDVNELLKLIDIADELLPENERQIDKQQTLTRLAACLKARITDEAACEGVLDAIGNLRDINTVRNKLAHGGAELVEALNRLSIEYPIRDYAKAWDRVRAVTAEALTTIRSALQGTL